MVFGEEQVADGDEWSGESLGKQVGWVKRMEEADEEGGRAGLSQS